MTLLWILCISFLSVAACTLYIRKQKSRKAPQISLANLAVGKGGRVYKRIPRDGIGAITVAIDGRLCKMNACSEDGMPIPSFTPVHVIKAMDDMTVSVATATTSVPQMT